MEKTGQTFEMNVESFTLQSIFAMELHRFQDKIAEIVNCAIKELAIEKVSLLDAHVEGMMSCVLCSPVTGESRSFAMSTAGPAAAAAVQRLVYTGDQSLTGRARGVAVEFK